MQARPLVDGSGSERTSSLMKCTEASQNAKNTPPGCGLLKPSVHKFWPSESAWFPVQELFGLSRECPKAQFELHISLPGGLRTPTHVAARQYLSRSPIRNVLLVPSVMFLDPIWLLPKKMPLLLHVA